MPTPEAMRGVDPPSPEEQLRRALMDLQEAHRQFVASYAHPDEAEAAAQTADAARAQAAQWGAIVRASSKLDDL